MFICINIYPVVTIGVKSMKYVTLLISILVLAACTPTGFVVQENTVKIGVITPLTGDFAEMGENIRDSAILALEELDPNGKYKLIIEDAGNVGEGRKAVSAYRSMSLRGDPQVIISGMASDAMLAVTPIYNEQEVVSFYPPTGGENIDQSGEYIFRIGPSDILAGQRPAEEIYAMEYKRVVLITDSAEYTTDISRHFRNNYKGEIILDESVPSNLNDYRTTITKALETEADAIVINSASGNSAGYMIKHIRETGSNIPIVANFLAFWPGSKTIAGDYLNDAYIYDPEFNYARAEDLLQRYEKRFGKQSPIPFQTAGTYDAIRMTIEAIEAVGNDGPAIREYLLENIQGWEGYNGVVSFDENGNSGTGFIRKVVRDGELVLE